MEFFVGLVIAGVVAYFVYQDAVSWQNEEITARGQSGVIPGLWAFGVFMFMIIFLPIYLIMRSSAKRNLAPTMARATVPPFIPRPPDAAAVTIPAGWLSDPTGEHEMRYWDGFAWTSHIHDSAVPSVPAPTGQLL